MILTFVESVRYDYELMMMALFDQSILIMLRVWWFWFYWLTWSWSWLLIDDTDFVGWIDCDRDSWLMVLMLLGQLIWIMFIDWLMMLIFWSDLILVMMIDWWCWFCGMNWLWTWSWLLTDEVDFVGWTDPDYNHWSMMSMSGEEDNLTFDVSRGR
jgi:hypothetical protein